MVWELGFSRETEPMGGVCVCVCVCVMRFIIGIGSWAYDNWEVSGSAICDLENQERW